MIVDIDKRLDDVNLGVLDAADTIFVVMTADLSCLKNVRLVLETIGHLGYEPSKVQLVLNRSNAFTGINVKNAEGALKRHDRPPDRERVPRRDQRPELAARRSCSPRRTPPLGRSLLDFARAIDKTHPARPAGRRAGSLTVAHPLRTRSAPG